MGYRKPNLVSTIGSEDASINTIRLDIEHMLVK